MALSWVSISVLLSDVPSPSISGTIQMVTAPRYVGFGGNVVVYVWIYFCLFFVVVD